MSNLSAPCGIDRAEVISRASRRLADVLADAAPSAPVPTCPGWDATDLLRHVVQVHQFWAAVIGDRLDGEQVGAFEDSRPELPRDVSTLLSLRADATATLLAALKSREESEHAWSWFAPDQTVGFTWRMQTHEATMHRVDAELAAGVPVSPIDAATAADGVTHVVDVMWAWTPDDARRRPHGVVELSATDTGDTWLVEVFDWSGTAWGQQFTDMAGAARGAAGATPDARIEGTAEALDLLVWTRDRGDAGIVRSGDQNALAAFQAVLDAGIQ